MFYRKTISILALLSLLIHGLAWVADAKIQPRVKLSVGQKFKLKLTYDGKMTQTVQGKKQVITDTATIVYSYDLQSVDETGDMTLKVTYDSIRLTEDGPLGKIAFDSATTAEVPQLVRGMAALVGQSYVMRMTPGGRVRSVTGADEMVAKAIEKHNILSEPWKSSMSKLLSDRFGNLPISESMQGLFGIYPDKPVAVGERWSRKLELPQNIAECFFKIMDRKDGILTIKSFITVKSNPEAPPIQIGLVNATSDATGKQEGTLKLDEVTGLILHAEQTNSSTGNLTIVSGGPKIVIPSTVTGTTTLEKL